MSYRCSAPRTPQHYDMSMSYPGALAWGLTWIPLAVLAEQKPQKHITQSSCITSWQGHTHPSMCRRHAGDMQATCRQHAGNMQATCRRHAGDMQATCS
jgi:hypothetical protein